MLGAANAVYVLYDKELNTLRGSILNPDFMSKFCETLSSTQRPLDTEVANILFRIFVWRDMVVELLEKKPMAGFSFGWPQRSISLEILKQAFGEWRRDGWIAPHNAFLHIFYRAGILGFIFLGIFFRYMIFMTLTVIRKRSLGGVALISILVYWTVVANLLVVWELPQQAIAFWSLFGLTYAYTNRLLQAEGGGTSPKVS